MADQQQEGFVRQRRNLMIASLVLLFSEVIDLKVQKIAVFGTDLVVGNPENVTNALWVATAYWLIRFYQYGRVQYTDAIEAALFDRIKSIGGSAASKLFLRGNPQITSEAPSKLTSNQRLKETDNRLLSPGATEQIRKGLPEPTIQFGSPTWIRKSPKLVEVTCYVSRGDSVFGDDNQRIVRLEGATLVWLRLRAWGYLILHTTLFTELILPYIVFLLPVVYFISRRIG